MSELYASRHRPLRYAFAARRDRRRAAQALGAGRAVAQVAAAERVAPVELERLMQEEGFKALVRHYGELAALPRAERLARLMTLALELLELAVECGDLRVAMFCLAEGQAGRDPAHSVAVHVTRMLEEAAEGRPRAAPRAVAARPKPAGRRPVGLDDWSHCAGTKATMAEAEAQALADAGALRAEHRRTLARLGLKLAAEAERAGTVDPLRLARDAEIRAVARHYQDRPAQSFAAAERLDRYRREIRKGNIVGIPGPSG